MSELPAPVDGLRWRRWRADDADRLFTLILEIDAVDDPGHPSIRSEFDSLLAQSEPERDLVLGERASTVVAFGWRRRPGGGSVRLVGGVHPAARGEGIGRRLLAAQIDAARRTDPDAPALGVRQTVRSDVAGLARRAGFTVARVFLSLLDGADGIAAFVVVHRSDEPGGDASVPLVGTAAPWRRRGVARALLADALAACRDAGCSGVALDVDASSPTGADRLYASLGFTRVSQAAVWQRSL